MKKGFTKFIAMFLFCTCILSVGFTQKASASVDYTYGWAFGITGVFDSNENLLTADSNNKYNLKENSVIVCTGYYDGYNNGYGDIYVRLDGVFLGTQTSTNHLSYDHWEEDGAIYDAFKLNNLTPGTHQIEVRTDRPWELNYYGPAQKYDTITVVVPGSTLSSTLSSTTSSHQK